LLRHIYYLKLECHVVRSSGFPIVGLSVCLLDRRCGGRRNCRRVDICQDVGSVNARCEMPPVVRVGKGKGYNRSSYHRHPRHHRRHHHHHYYIISYARLNILCSKICRLK